MCKGTRVRYWVQHGPASVPPVPRFGTVDRVRGDVAWVKYGPPEWPPQPMRLADLEEVER